MVAAIPWTPFEEFLLNAGTAVFLIAVLIEAAFLVHYIIVAPAFKSWIGWMFVLRSASFLLAGIAIMVGRIFGPFYPARPYLTLSLYVVVLGSALITYVTFLLERYNRDNPRRTTPDAPHSFARRALGLLGRRRASRQDDARPQTRPLRIVKD